MKTLLIGNALCFAGSTIMTLIGFIKDRKRFLAAQCGMNSIFIAGNLFLGGISGAVSNFVTMLRNIICLRYEITVPLKILFSALFIGLTAAFGCNSIIMWLPVIGNCVFTWYMDTENMVLLKLIVIGSQIMWGIYDLSIYNYATVPFDIAAVITNAAAIAAIFKERKGNM